MNLSNVQYDHPCVNDSVNIYQLIMHCPPLDVNSLYYYYVFCRDFQKTCVIAKYDNLALGFISSFIKPEDATCLFIWQIAVLEEARQKKIASSMLRWLIKQPVCQHIKSLEVTFSPSNHASQNLFKHFAQEYGISHQITTFLSSSQFHGQVHEEEMLLKISLSHTEG
jgi:diaminobutyrate acetyltransferase